jgi:hypothetical protein
MRSDTITVEKLARKLPLVTPWRRRGTRIFQLFVRLLTVHVTMGHAVMYWLKHYVISRKVAGSRPDELNFSIYLILLAALGSGVHSASNRNEYQKQKNNVSGE